MPRCKIKQREYNLRYYIANKERRKAELNANPEKKKDWARKKKIYMDALKADNPNWVREQAAKFREKIKNDPERYEKRMAASRVAARGWRDKNPERFKDNCRRWRNSDAGRRSIAASRVAARKRNPETLLKARHRWRINSALRGKNKKFYSSAELLGCSYAFLRQHIESLFVPGMSWENRHLWHVDHIRPVASFDLLQPEQQRCCFHYSNLQPLWAADNIKKSDKICL